MRKRTKVMLIVAALSLVACGVGVGLFLGLAAATAIFDVILTAGAITLGSLVITGTVAGITKGIKKKLEKEQTEIAARLLETNLTTNPVGVNVKELSSQLSNVNAKLVNEHNVFGAIKDNGYEDDVKKIRSEMEIIRERIKAGSLSEKNIKKLKKKEKRLQNVIDSSDQLESDSDMGRYSYKSTIGNEITDERNQISCMTSETRNNFIKFIESDSAVENRVSQKNRNSRGYAVSLNFNGSDVKKTFARSNSGENMEMCEYMLLSEVKNEVDKNPTLVSTVFPIVIKRKHFTKESGGKGTIIIVSDQSALDARVQTLGEYLKHPEQSKSNQNKDYIVRKYEPGFLNPEEMYDF